MAEYLLLRIRCIVADRTIIITLLLVMLSTLATYTFPYVGYNYSIDRYRDNFENIGGYDELGSHTDLPADIVESMAADRQQLLAILIANAAGDDHAEYVARLQYERNGYELALRGYTSEPAISVMRRMVFYERLLQNQQYYVYTDIHDMPAAYFLASQSFRLSPFILFRPACVTLAAAFSSAQGTKSRFLEDVIPLDKPSILIADSLAGLIVALGMLVMALLPTAVYQCFLNGFGDISYPVVDIVNRQLAETTLGAYLLSLCVLVLFSYCYLASLSMLVSRMTDSRTAMLFILLLSCLAPSIPSFMAVFVDLGVERYTPLAYLSVTPVIGIVDTYENPTQFNGATLPLGVVVLSIHALVNIVLAFSLDRATSMISGYLGGGRVGKPPATKPESKA